MVLHGTTRVTPHPHKHWQAPAGAGQAKIAEAATEEGAGGPTCGRRGERRGVMDLSRSPRAAERKFCAVHEPDPRDRLGSVSLHPNDTEGTRGV